MLVDGRRETEMRTAVMFSSDSPEWATPQDFFDALDSEFHFTLDPCCTHENAKCVKHYTIEENGLAQNWGGGDGLLQSSLWPGTAQMGTQMP